MTEYAALSHTVGRWHTMHADLAMLPHPFVMPTGVLLVASIGAEAVGCGALVAREAGVAEIKRVYVRPTARGQGIGAAMLRSLLVQAKAMEVERVRLDTVPELTEAIALYRRLGFTPIPHYRADLLPDALCFEYAVERWPRS